MIFWFYIIMHQIGSEPLPVQIGCFMVRGMASKQPNVSNDEPYCEEAIQKNLEPIHPDIIPVGTIHHLSSFIFSSSQFFKQYAFFFLFRGYY
jgi:hypothetical protein